VTARIDAESAARSTIAAGKQAATASMGSPDDAATLSLAVAPCQSCALRRRAKSAGDDGAAASSARSGRPSDTLT